MKIQIDTNSKTIKLEETVELKELIEMLNNLFPNCMWKEYKLEMAIIQNWNYPNTIIIDKTLPYPYPWTNPFWYNTTTSKNTNEMINQTNTGTSIFNIDYKLQ